MLPIEPLLDQAQDFIPMEGQGLGEDLPDELRSRDLDHKGANRVAPTGSKSRRILDLQWITFELHPDRHVETNRGCLGE